VSNVNQYGACPDSSGGCCDVTEFLSNFFLGLIYESASISIAKCGEVGAVNIHVDPSQQNVFWKHRHDYFDAFDPDGDTYHVETDWSYAKDGVGACILTYLRTGSSVRTEPDVPDDVVTLNTTNPSPPDIWTGIVDGEAFSGVWSNPVSGPGAGGTVNESTIYSNVYTDAAILTEGMTELDSALFAPGASDAQSILLNYVIGVVDSGVGANMRKIRYKIQHRPTITCYLKVWLYRRFRPFNTFGASDVATVLGSPYEWNGSGDPCLPDFTEGYLHENNLITQGDWTVEMPPDTEGGQHFIEVWKFSFIEGYVPDDPTLEVGVLTRPDPDLNSNGFPTTP